MLKEGCPAFVLESFIRHSAFDIRHSTFPSHSFSYAAYHRHKPAESSARADAAQYRAR